MVRIVVVLSVLVLGAAEQNETTTPMPTTSTESHNGTTTRMPTTSTESHGGTTSTTTAYGGACNADTGGTCKYFGCHEWRRGAVCDANTSKCLCPEGTCSSPEGVCMPQEATCNRDTGGSCVLFGCNDYRRGAKCNTTDNHKCLCPHGMCSSMDGICVKGREKEFAGQRKELTGNKCSKFFGYTVPGFACPSEDEVGPTECMGSLCICKEGYFYFCYDKPDNRTMSGCSQECKCQKHQPQSTCTPSSAPTAAPTSAPAASLQI